MQKICRIACYQQEEGVSAPFMAGTFPVTLAKGIDPFRGGFTVPCYMVFSGSIPTVADCLMAVKKLVFEEKHCTPTQMLEALQDNFEGHETLRQRCLAAPKFGNDDDRVDLIAADIARRFCGHVVSHRTLTGKPLWPALYNYLFNDHAKTLGATPDGRKWRDPIAEHYSPTPGRASNGPTSVICSAAKGPLAEACGSSVFNISLSRSMMDSSEQGRLILRGLLDGALKQGVAVMNIAIYDIKQMREAQRHPEKHEDMIVRVWGFCARFVDLSCDMQEHIIQRVLADRT